MLLAQVFVCFSLFLCLSLSANFCHLAAPRPAIEFLFWNHLERPFWAKSWPGGYARILAVSFCLCLTGGYGRILAVSFCLCLSVTGGYGRLRRAKQGEHPAEHSSQQSIAAHNSSNPRQQPPSPPATISNHEPRVNIL